MEKQEWLDKAAQSILDADEEAAVKIAAEALEAGLEPVEMIDGGFARGIREMGDLFERGTVFLPTLIIGSEAMVAAVKILEAALPADQQNKKLATIVLGTVEGDVHDIGKGILATMLRVNGFEVYDLGRDVPIEDFIAKAKEVNANMVGSSALMTTTQVGQKMIEQLLKKEGLRDQIKTMVGGAVATQRWADRIGADLYGETAGDTVTKLKELFD